MARLFAPAAQGPRARVTRWFAAHVRHGATREIPVAAAGRMTVHCRNGEAWITHDGDPKDVMLQPNQSYAVRDRGGRMTVHAMKGDCIFEIQVDD
ncbi:MAG: hypothetical protein JWP22_847 [Ramlibacter sp.]|nr:hypothetical protein [Ramlibacter sp.]MDB5912172.1 hypothetical protein [Ramlibacter sp.]